MLANLAQQLLQQLQEHLPPGAPPQLKRELHSALQTALGKLDLVTREEFDAQAAVLLRTREKLEALEAQISQLESHH